MSANLPAPIATYLAGVNRQDIDAMLATFSADPKVTDEGATRTGRAAVRLWMEETTRKYGVSLQTMSAEEEGDRLALHLLMTGNFPGSPAHITYRFTLRGDEIVALEIS